MDETSIKGKGAWRYLYRAVDKTGQTIHCLLTEHRDEQAAKRSLTKAIRRHGVPETMTIDGSAANKAAIESYNAEYGTTIAIRQTTYLNNSVEQDHRAVKRVTWPMLGFKSFHAARRTLVGIELMHMMKKKQGVGAEDNDAPRAAEQFSSLAVEAPHRQGQPALSSPLSKIWMEPCRIHDKLIADATPSPLPVGSRLLVSPQAVLIHRTRERGQPCCPVQVACPPHFFGP
jgi:hypothetical protein